MVIRIERGKKAMAGDADHETDKTESIAAQGLLLRNNDAKELGG